jgi:hypothetical protein
MTTTTTPTIDKMNDPLFQYNFARAFIEKVTVAISENADLIAADPTLWRQDVSPFNIAMHLGAMLPMEQLVALYNDHDQLTTILVAAISV